MRLFLCVKFVNIEIQPRSKPKRLSTFLSFFLSFPFWPMESGRFACKWFHYFFSFFLEASGGQKQGFCSRRFKKSNNIASLTLFSATIAALACSLCLVK